MKYKELNYESKSERSCYIPGRVYLYPKEGDSRRSRSSLDGGDLLLCLFKSGDCHYDFVRIVQTSQTQTTGTLPLSSLECYYKLEEKVACYGTYKEAFPEMRTFEPYELVRILHSEQVLIPLKETMTKTDIKEWEAIQGTEENLKERKMKMMQKGIPMWF